MKETALRILVCPSCRSALTLEETSREASEVAEGSLRCTSCGRVYRITGGVPRFVDDSEYAASFGFQWSRFREVQLDSRNGTRQSEDTLRATTGWEPEDCRRKIVLDAGVGAGRFAEVIAKWGGEVVGLDLTPAVDAAFRNIGRNENVHLVQADIFRMPFRDGGFDLAYSIGVLHHTPDTRAAFERVAAAVRPGGQLAVYLYSRYGSWYRGSDLLRKLTTRMPPKLLLSLCRIAIPLHPIYRAPLLGKLLRLAAPISPHPDPRWRWLDTFDWYSPKYQWKLLYPEVFRWFRDNGFTNVQIFDGPIRMRGTRTGE